MVRERRAKEIGRRIADILEAKGWRKTDLITRSGLKQASVYEWLRGESEPRGDGLIRIAQALEVSTDYLLGSEPTYTELSCEQVAARESLRVCLRRLEIPPGHPEYPMYQELAATQGAPKSVEGWHEFITEFLPKITEHLRANPRTQGSDRSHKVFPLKRPETASRDKKGKKF